MVHRDSNNVKKDNRTQCFSQKYLGGHIKAKEEGCDGDHSFSYIVGDISAIYEQFIVTLATGCRVKFKFRVDASKQRDRTESMPEEHKKMFSVKDVKKI